MSTVNEVDSHDNEDNQVCELWIKSTSLFYLTTSQVLWSLVERPFFSTKSLLFALSSGLVWFIVLCIDWVWGRGGEVVIHWLIKTRLQKYVVRKPEDIEIIFLLIYSNDGYT